MRDTIMGTGRELRGTRGYGVAEGEETVRPGSLRVNFCLSTARTVLNFLLPLVTFPYVSRVLGPDGLGKVDFANSIVSYFLLFTALGIPTYGMREIARVRDDAEVRSRTVAEFSVILCATVALGYIVYFALVFSVPQFYEQKMLFFSIAPTIFLSDFSYDWFYQGVENQTYITVRYIVIKFFQVTCIFLLVRNPQHFLRYAAITVGLSSLSTLFNIVHLRKYIHPVPVRRLRPLRHIKPMLVIFASVLATSIYMHLDVTMVGFISGDEYVGLYTAANKLVRMVISLVTALSAVMLPRLENCLEKGDETAYLRYLNLSLRYILVLAVPCCLGMFAIAPDIIAIFAGEKYAASVRTLRILSSIILIVPLAYFTGLQILYPRRMEWKYTVSVSVAAAVNAVCNALLIPRLAQDGAALGTVVAEALGLAIQMAFARNFVGGTELFTRNTLKYVAAALVMLAAVRFVPYVRGSVVLHCALCVVLAVVVYGGMLLLLRERIAMQIAHRMRGR